MKNVVAVVVLLLLSSVTTVFAFESLPDRTGFAAKVETKYDAYGVARVNRDGIAVNYQNQQIGLSATASTGVAFLREPRVHVDTQYFGISAAYHVLRAGPVDVGIVGEFTCLPPFKMVAVRQVFPGAVIPQGAIEFNNGVIFQMKPVNDLTVYMGPAYTWFYNDVDVHGFGVFAGVKYKVTDHISVGASLMQADRSHMAGSIIYGF